MAITKIHPIKSTLNLAIDYITKNDKTDEKILITSHSCNPKTAYMEFEETKNEHNSRAIVLARHLIQSFAPDETTPEEAHKIGIELCEKILKGEYEYVLATHIDRGHIHNHIIFNNVNFNTGKAYQSNKKTYHQIRNQSDKLCEKYNLSVIDNDYKTFKNKYKTKGKGYKEWSESKSGNSWKSKLQLAIDKAILKANDFDDFIKIMESFGYEIKKGKHIAFRHKDQERFTRGKRIGEDYTEEKIRERIENKDIKQTKNFKYDKTPKSAIDNVIDISKNEKAKSSKGYEIWARKHNLNAMASTLNEFRKYGVSNIAELESKLKSEALKRQEITGNMKSLENKMDTIYEQIENLNTIKECEQVYKMYKENPKDTEFYNEYRDKIVRYEVARDSLKTSFPGTKKIKDLISEFENLKTKRSILMKEYSDLNMQISKMVKIKNNFEKYANRGVER